MNFISKKEAQKLIAQKKATLIGGWVLWVRVNDNEVVVYSWDGNLGGYSRSYKAPCSKEEWEIMVN